MTEGKGKIYKNIYLQDLVLFAGENEETNQKKKNTEQLVSDKIFEPLTFRNKAKVLDNVAETLVFNEATILSIDFVIASTWLLTVLLIAT